MVNDATGSTGPPGSTGAGARTGAFMIVGVHRHAPFTRSGTTRFAVRNMRPMQVMRDRTFATARQRGPRRLGSSLRAPFTRRHEATPSAPWAVLPAASSRIVTPTSCGRGLAVAALAAGTPTMLAATHRARVVGRTRK